MPTFCAPTPITEPDLAAPVVKPVAAAVVPAAPTSFGTVAPAVPPIPCVATPEE